MPCMWARPTVTELRAIMGLTSGPRILLCRRTCHWGDDDDHRNYHDVDYKDGSDDDDDNDRNDDMIGFDQ